MSASSVYFYTVFSDFNSSQIEKHAAEYYNPEKV